MVEVSNEQIESWKRDHGKVYVAKAEGLVGYFRKPTRKELSYAMTLREKPLEMTERVATLAEVVGASVGGMNAALAATTVYFSVLIINK